MERMQWEDMVGQRIAAIGWGTNNYVVLRFDNGTELHVEADSAFDKDGMLLEPAGMSDID